MLGKLHCTKMKFFIKNFLSKCDQICSFLLNVTKYDQIRCLVKKFLMKSTIVSAVLVPSTVKYRFVKYHRQITKELRKNIFRLLLLFVSVSLHNSSHFGSLTFIQQNATGVGIFRINAIYGQHI